MDKWKVSYEDLRCKRMSRPFFKNQTVVSAESRKGAIEQVSLYMFSPPVYGNYRASKVRD